MSESQQLQELHDTCVWEVNEAVGEGRLDRIDLLTDRYVEQSLALITAGGLTGCGTPDCAVCHPAPLERPRHRWFSRRR